MKQAAWMAGTAALAAGLMMYGAGCDWSGGGGSDSFNTSQGAGVNVNISGVYKGNIKGKAVARTSSGNIVSLVLAQTGNRLDVTDNQGSHYKGTVGTPAAVGTPDANNIYQAGAEIMQTQVSWEGNDEIAAQSISFVGIVHVVGVTDIKGSSDVSSDASSTVSSDARTDTQTQDLGSNVVVTTTYTIGDPTDAFYQQTVTTVTYDKATGKQLNKTVTTTGNKTRTKTSNTTYSITEANSQFRLEGTWIERDGGGSSPVDALSSGGSGVITYSQTVDTGTGGGGIVTPGAGGATFTTPNG